MVFKYNIVMLCIFWGNKTIAPTEASSSSSKCWRNKLFRKRLLFLLLEWVPKNVCNSSNVFLFNHDLNTLNGLDPFFLLRETQIQMFPQSLDFMCSYVLGFICYWVRFYGPKLRCSRPWADSTVPSTVQYQPIFRRFFFNYIMM